MAVVFPPHGGDIMAKRIIRRPKAYDPTRNASSSSSPCEGSVQIPRSPAPMQYIW